MIHFETAGQRLWPVRRLHPLRLTNKNAERKRQMPLNALNHFTIRPVDLERTKDFYCDVLGLPIGYRPPLGFPGYWLYCGAIPTVHLIGPRENDPARAPAAPPGCSTTSPSPAPGSPR